MARLLRPCVCLSCSHLLPSMRYGYAPWATLFSSCKPEPGTKAVAKVGPAQQQQGPQPRSITVSRGCCS